jgi:hypothetical protein
MDAAPALSEHTGRILREVENGERTVADWRRREIV